MGQSIMTAMVFYFLYLLSIKVMNKIPEGTNQIFGILDPNPLNINLGIGSQNLHSVKNSCRRSTMPIRCFYVPLAGGS